LGKRCYIVGAGEFSGRFMPAEYDYIIAADAGYAALMDSGIVPDMVVGDFDSLGEAPGHPCVVRASADKDDTDMMMAVREGLAKGCGSFIIDGALGGRLDHTLANIQLLKMIASKGAGGILLGRDICITAITNAKALFSPAVSGIISIFALSGIAEGVTLTGLKYCLSDATLTDIHPIGVSNEFIGSFASVSVKNGTLLITWEGEAGELLVES